MGAMADIVPSSGTGAMADIVLKMPSGFFNVINFVLFDLVLAGIIFYLTADIAGLCNSSSALKKSDQRLFPFNPPVLGVGLTSTRRSVFYSLAFIRLLTIAAILGTNFLSEGGAVPASTVHNALVSAPGRLPRRINNFTPFILNRQACLGHTDSTEYYGQLRKIELDGRNITSCERRLDWIGPTVHFSLKPRSVVLRIRGCTKKTTKDHDVYYCDNAIFSCLHRVNTNWPDFCMGASAQDGTAYICKVRAGNPESFGEQLCREARGLDWDNDSWVVYGGRELPSIQDVYDAIYYSGRERKKVRVAKQGARDVLITRVQVWWFIVLGLTLAVIVALAILSVVLRAGGLIRIANDEIGLGKLLSVTTTSGAASGSIESADDMSYRLLERKGFMVQLKGSRVMATPNERYNPAADPPPPPSL